MPSHSNKKVAGLKREPMPAPKSKNQAFKGGLEKLRSDLTNDRVPSDSFIAKTTRPILDSRERWLDQAIANGVGIENLVLGTGYPVRFVMTKAGINPDANPEQLEKLNKLRADNPR